VCIDSVIIDSGVTTVFAAEVTPCPHIVDGLNPSIVVAIEGACRDVSFAPLRVVRDSTPCE